MLIIIGIFKTNLKVLFFYQKLKPVGNLVSSLKRSEHKILIRPCLLDFAYMITAIRSLIALLIFFPLLTLNFGHCIDTVFPTNL